MSAKSKLPPESGNAHEDQESAGTICQGAHPHRQGAPCRRVRAARRDAGGRCGDRAGRDVLAERGHAHELRGGDGARQPDGPAARQIADELHRAGRSCRRDRQARPGEAESCRVGADPEGHRGDQQEAGCDPPESGDPQEIQGLQRHHVGLRRRAEGDLRRAQRRRYRHRRHDGHAAAPVADDAPGHAGQAGHRAGRRGTRHLPDAAQALRLRAGHHPVGAGRRPAAGAVRGGAADPLDHRCAAACGQDRRRHRRGQAWP